MKLPVDVLHILQADNLENDYRLIKECQSLVNSGASPQILYFHVNNKDASHGALKCGSPWVRKRLFTRRFFKSGSFLWVKLFEQWMRSAVAVLLKRPSIVCVHDDRFFGLIPILCLFRFFRLIDRVIWDQRELPLFFLGGSRLKYSILEALVYLCDAVAMANQERKEIVATSLGLNQQLLDKIHVISNYPDLDFVNLKIDTTTAPTQFLSDVRGSRYLYLQSPTEPDRFFHNTVEAILSHANLKLVISGRVGELERLALLAKFGSTINKKIIYIGLIDPYELPVFMENALASCVFYGKNSLNQMYCAPNRLYQSLARALPLLVGDNPSLKNIVDTTKSGVVIDGDGGDVDAISDGIFKIIANEVEFKKNAKLVQKEFSWEGQNYSVLAFFYGV